jgi:hypothetical protein
MVAAKLFRWHSVSSAAVGEHKKASAYRTYEYININIWEHKYTVFYIDASLYTVSIGMYKSESFIRTEAFKYSCEQVYFIYLTLRCGTFLRMGGDGGARKFREGAV